MSTKSKLTSGVTLVVALLAIAIPIWLTIVQARAQGLAAATNQVRGYARDVLHRSESTGMQADNAIKSLVAAQTEDRCSVEQLALMRKLDLASSYIQAVGVVADNRLQCASLGLDLDGIPIGPPDLTTEFGVKVRYDVRLPFAPDYSFIMLERDGYGAIIHPDLPIDASTDERNVSLATYMVEDHHILTSRGHVERDWLDRLGNDYEVTFAEDGYLVVILRSKIFLTGSIAAIPTDYLDKRVRSFALFLIPVGLLAGLVLSFSVYSLARVRTALPSVIKMALRNDEFFLNYQPIVDLQSGKWVGAEALIRWKRASGEMIRPDIFIPVAEESGLIQRITARVMDLIAQSVGDLFTQYPGFHIAINLASDDLKSPHTIELLNQLAKRTNASPHNLLVEATERGFMTGASAREIIKQIRAKGIAVAIDDFGTGYSSLSYLETFELDYLKIDKSFVDSVGGDAATSQVVPHIIEMSKDLKLAMIAEGVETETQAQFLRERGVQFAQGWLFGKPMPFEELVAKLATQADPSTKLA